MAIRYNGGLRLGVTFGYSEVLYFTQLAAALVHDDDADMAATVFLPVYKHGAKVLKIRRAPPIFRKYFLEIPKNQQLTVLDRNECQSQEIISTETEIHRYFPLITNPHNAGICVGLCRYLH